MNFSTPIKFSGICSFSPNNQYFALTKHTDLLIYKSETLLLYHKFSFGDVISHIQWAKDSGLIMIGFFKMGIVEVKHLDNLSWECKIDEVLISIKNIGACRDKLCFVDTG